MKLIAQQRPLYHHQHLPSCPLLFSLCITLPLRELKIFFFFSCSHYHYADQLPLTHMQAELLCNKMSIQKHSKKETCSSETYTFTQNPFFNTFLLAWPNTNVFTIIYLICSRAKICKASPERDGLNGSKCCSETFIIPSFCFHMHPIIFLL